MFNCIRQVKKDIWVILFLLFVSIYTIFNLKHWNESDRIIVWDVISYYGYLPAAFIYGDVTLQNPNEKYNTLDHNFWYHETLEKSKVFKTSMGMAILYSPFFFLSHIYVLCTDGEASGFSTPYRFGIAQCPQIKRISLVFLDQYFLFHFGFFGLYCRQLSLLPMIRFYSYFYLFTSIY